MKWRLKLRSKLKMVIKDDDNSTIGKIFGDVDDLDDLWRNVRRKMK